jgi:hypothetical protein
MNRGTVLVGITALAVLVACAKKEMPQAQAEDDEDVSTTATQVQPAAPQPKPKDQSRAAASMMTFIDPSPRCQQYRDELEAKKGTPATDDEMSEIFVRAHQAGCGKKKQQ